MESNDTKIAYAALHLTKKQGLQNPYQGGFGQSAVKLTSWLDVMKHRRIWYHSTPHFMRNLIYQFHQCVTSSGLEEDMALSSLGTFAPRLASRPNPKEPIQY